MFTVENLQSQVAEKIEGSPSGCQAIFIKLDEKWGLKLYLSADERDKSYKIQKRCFKKGWAPEVGEVFDIPLEGPNGRQYGYITEVVETLEHLPRYDDPRRSEVQKKKDEWYDKYYYTLEGGMSLVEKWVEQIQEETGFCFRDDHCYNWGRKDGKWIPIDFG